jgi:hypothetical protein
MGPPAKELSALVMRINNVTLVTLAITNLSWTPVKSILVFVKTVCQQIKPMAAMSTMVNFVKVVMRAII